MGKIEGHIEIFDDFFLNKNLLVDLVVGKSNTQLDCLLFWKNLFISKSLVFLKKSSPSNKQIIFPFDF